MKTYSFYSQTTGLILPIIKSCPDADLELNTPEGCAALEGRYDYLSQRVDIETKRVVDYQPPAPDDDHVWNDKTKRWQLSEEARAAIAADQQARAAIALVEASSLRALREGLLELLPEESPARAKLQPVEDAIAAQRPNIKRG